jgi:hypothetical protein
MTFRRWLVAVQADVQLGEEQKLYGEGVFYADVHMQFECGGFAGGMQCGGLKAQGMRACRGGGLPATWRVRGG